MLTIMVCISLALNLALICGFVILRTSKSKAASAKKTSSASLKSADKPVAATMKETQNPTGGCRVQHMTPDEKGILSGLTVLVVDDDETNIEVLTGMLEVLGLTSLVTANDGAEAVDYAGQKAFDIIYMDIQMPKKTGIEAAKEIRAGGKNQKTPIVPITGFSRIVNADMCKDAGMNGFLQKPVDLSKLEQTTMRALQARDKQRAA